MRINEKIKELRILSKMSQNELAKKINVSQDTISLWERGISLPSIEYLIELCNIFDVSSDYLLGLED